MNRISNWERETNREIILEALTEGLDILSIDYLNLIGDPKLTGEYNND